MIRKSFFGSQKTVIAALLKGDTVNSFIHQARNAEFAGADGIVIELCLLPPEQRTVENFKTLMASVRLPFMFCVYRNDLWFKGDDKARQKGLLAAAEAGAEVIDVMGDLFDPSPRELTRDKSAVRRQKKLIGEIQDRDMVFLREKRRIPGTVKMLRGQNQCGKFLFQQQICLFHFLHGVTAVDREIPIDGSYQHPAE